MYAVNFTQVLENGTIFDQNWPIKSCSHGWEYSRIEIPYETIATEVCALKMRYDEK